MLGDWDRSTATKLLYIDLRIGCCRDGVCDHPAVWRNLSMNFEPRVARQLLGVSNDQCRAIFLERECARDETSCDDSNDSRSDSNALRCPAKWFFRDGCHRRSTGSACN